MKTVFVILLIVAGMSVATLFNLARKSRMEMPPGLQSGQLAPCPQKNNCVSSEAEEIDRFSIAPFHFIDDENKEEMS